MNREWVEALASPVRQDIVDTVQALGECSIREAAQALGRPADGLYYHVRELVRASLLVKVAGTGEARFTTQRPEEDLQIDYDPAGPDDCAALGRMVGAMLRVAERDFVAAMARGGACVKGPRRELWAARTKGWISEEDLEEANELLERLHQLLRKDRRPGQRLHALTFVMSPVEAEGIRRESKSKD